MGKVRALQLVALGSNLSTPGCSLEQRLQQAILAMVKQGLAIRLVSRFFHSPCFPAGVGPDYVNAVVGLEKTCCARETLDRLHAIEADFGRERTQRWGQRTLDLDLIADENEVLPNEAVFSHWRALSPAKQAKVAPDVLVLPHPRLQDRAFVLKPLVDIAAGWTHPVLCKTSAQMLAELPKGDVEQVIPI